MKPQPKRPTLTQFARIALLIVSLVVTTQTVAQSDQERMHRERDRLQQEQNNDYHHRILPQQQQEAAEQANRLSGPPDWSPGEIRTPQNHGALAWYEKGANEYGYVFVSGFISQLSADIQVDIECERLRLKCEAKKLVSNGWLAIGSYNDRVHFATAGGGSRSQAEKLVQEQCRKDGTTCTIKDAFEVLPHPRGVNRQRIKLTVR